MLSQFSGDWIPVVWGSTGILAGVALGWLMAARKHRRLLQAEQEARQAEQEQSAQWRVQISSMEQQIGALRGEVERFRGFEVQAAQWKTMAEQRAEQTQRLQQQLTDLEKSLDLARQRNVSLEKDLAELTVALDKDRQAAEEKIALLLEAKEQMSAQFEKLAAEVMERKASTLDQQHRKTLSAIIDPFKEQIGQFRQRVEHIYEAETRDRTSLIQELQQLKQLNQQITEEAANLTRALKGDRKAQGNWGEVILERVLEASGLQKGREYEVQKALRDDKGSLFRPDVIVHLPDNKDIVVDAKVSLSAYERYTSAEEEPTRRKAATEHVKALREHIKGLASKRYDMLQEIKTLDFVFLFVPIEPAYLLAVQEDPNLFSDAFAQKIIVVSPTTLLATLRIVENVWRFERQNRNAETIAIEAGRLYDKFVGFASNLDSVRDRLAKTQDELDQAIKKLHTGNGNLVSRVRKLRKLGAKTKKNMDTALSPEWQGEDYDELPEPEASQTPSEE
jgi:DNA recombination protein RmuC